MRRSVEVGIEGRDDGALSGAPTEAPTGAPTGTLTATMAEAPSEVPTGVPSAEGGRRLSHQGLENSREESRGGVPRWRSVEVVEGFVSMPRTSPADEALGRWDLAMIGSWAVCRRPIRGGQSDGAAEGPDPRGRSGGG